MLQAYTSVSMTRLNQMYLFFDDLFVLTVKEQGKPITVVYVPSHLYHMVFELFKVRFVFWTLPLIYTLLNLSLHLISHNLNSDIFFIYLHLSCIHLVIWSHEIKAVLHFENLWCTCLVAERHASHHGVVRRCLGVSSHPHTGRSGNWRSDCQGKRALLDSSLIYFFTYLNFPEQNPCLFKHQVWRWKPPPVCVHTTCPFFRWAIGEEACPCGRSTGCSPTRTPRLLGPASTAHVPLLWSVSVMDRCEQWKHFSHFTLDASRLYHHYKWRGVDFI